MNSSNKTLKSVVVLSAIAMVATTILVVLNAVLPGPPLPGLGESLPFLRQIMPDTQFEIYDNIDLGKFNAENADSNTKVSVVFKATGGKFSGNFAVRFQTKGYSGTIDALVGYDKESAILGVATLNNPETSPSGNVYLRGEDFNNFFVLNGKDPNTPVPNSPSIAMPNHPNGIGSGASVSFRAYVRGVNLATRLAMELNDIAVVLTWADATEAETNTLRQVVGDPAALFSKADGKLLSSLEALAQDKSQELVAVYAKRTGVGANQTIVIESEGNGGNYGNISVMTVF